MNDKLDFLTVAKDYFDRLGWAVIPVTGKVPIARQWSRYQHGSMTIKAIRGFKWNNATGLALILGTPSGGVRVRDFDQPDAYEAWAASQPELAKRLPTSKTARGFHVFFEAVWPDTVTPLGDGELRGGSGIVLLPPSVHPDGPIYKWLIAPEPPLPFIADVSASGLSSRWNSGVGGSVTAVPEKVSAAISKSLPAEFGQRHAKIFEFVRRLKAFPNLDVSPAAMASYIAAWHTAALPFIRTKDFDESEFDFVYGWNNSRVPLSDQVFTESARNTLNSPPPAWTEGRVLPSSAKQLASVCAWAQEYNGDQPFFLSARTAGNILGIHHTLAGRLLNMLLAEGALELVEKGTQETRRASEWRYRDPTEDEYVK